MPQDDLFPNGKPAGKEAIDRVFEQYKLAVEMWDRVRARRHLSNSFYLTINAAIAAAAGVEKLRFPLAILMVAGLIICALWIANIRLYGSLADDKRRVVIELERLLPSAPFSAEQGADRRSFTLIERCIPIAFILLYAALLARMVVTGAS